MRKPSRIPEDINTHLAWCFEEILPSRFRRSKIDFAHTDFPILAPLPPAPRQRRPIEGGDQPAPFIYFVLNASGDVCYVGMTLKAPFLSRWIRPGLGGPASHYWTHAIANGGCVKNIEAGLRAGDGPFELRFTSVMNLPLHYWGRLDLHEPLVDKHSVELAEERLTRDLLPIWNIHNMK